MTIEIGVVSGNLDRVAGELEELMVDLLESNLINAQKAEDYRLELEGLRLRSESFLRSLGDDREDEVVNSELKTEKLGMTVSSSEPVTSPPVSEFNNEKQSAQASLKSDQQKSSATLKDNFRTTTENTNNVIDQSDEDTLKETANTSMLQQQLQIQQSEISEIKNLLHQLVESTVADSSNSEQIALTKVVSAVQNNDQLAAENIVLNFLASHDPATNNSILLVKELMESLSENVMKRSRGLLWLFSWLAIAEDLDKDQKAVIAKLRDYHQDLQADSNAKVLPSPWGRGMETLFQV